MAHHTLNDFIAALEQAGELRRIPASVNPALEIAEITDRIMKQPGGGPALLFEQTGTAFPVLINAMGSDKRIAIALGAGDLEDIGKRIEDLFALIASPKKGIWDKLRMLPQLAKLSSWMPKSRSGRGACQEVVMPEPSLAALPVLTCWPADGGPFVTFPMVITRDPDTGTRNVGMYRMQVFDNLLTGMHWHRHKTGARHYEAYKRRGERMPVAVALGGDPAHTFAATAPLPDNIDEFMLSGFLRKKHVELVRCLTCDLEVPADADIIIEGYVDPTEELIWEGPFGDHTGFYSLPDYYPRFHVTAITHRRNAVFPATIVGVPPMEDAYIAKATERIFLAPIRLAMLPEIADMDMPPAGVAHNLALVSLHKTYPGQGPKAMHALWGAGQMMFNKVLVAVDKAIDVHDYLLVAQELSSAVCPMQDIHISSGPMDVLDHSSAQFAQGGKLFIDGTSKVSPEQPRPVRSLPNALPSAEVFMKLTPSVRAVNTLLPAQRIACVIAAVDKDRGDAPLAIASRWHEAGLLSGISCLIFVDHPADTSNLFDCLWLTLNNADPQRDCHILKDEQGGLLVADGTRKRTAEGFERHWPNPVSSSPDTQELCDRRWPEYQLGSLIPSPSKKYGTLATGTGAYAEKNSALPR